MVLKRLPDQAQLDEINLCCVDFDAMMPADQEKEIVIKKLKKSTTPQKTVKTGSSTNNWKTHDCSD